MLKMIDDFLNKTTMYRLLIYYLGGLLVLALVLSLFGNLNFTPFELLVSTAILLAANLSINAVFAYIFKVPANQESAIITSLILALIMTPKLGLYDITFLLAASGLAMASKYLLTVGDMHIFNPAAVALVLTALGPQQSASWWVGTANMLPLVMIGGLLVMRKIRREWMVAIYLVVGLLTTVLLSQNAGQSLQEAVFTSSLFFLGFVMLTEPLTSPGTRGKQLVYAALVGFLAAPQVHIGSFYTSPELALVVGNFLTFLVDRRVRIFPELIGRKQVSNNTADFIFRSDRKLKYRPGQYMEWTLAHNDVDNRGIRRYFTLASSPTERDIRLGVKFYNPSSTYKQAMLNMTGDDQVVAAHVVGDFTLPRSKSKKLVFIAGGIGVTPFRSMIKYLIDKNERRDITLIYAADSANDVAYRDIFEQARAQLGAKVIYVYTKPNAALDANSRAGYIDATIIRDLVPDAAKRSFYISGSHSMVQAVKAALWQSGAKRRKVKVDYFPGYN